MTTPCIEVFVAEHQHDDPGVVGGTGPWAVAVGIAATAGARMVVAKRGIKRGFTVPAAPKHAPVLVIAEPDADPLMPSSLKVCFGRPRPDLDGPQLFLDVDGDAHPAVRDLRAAGQHLAAVAAGDQPLDAANFGVIRLTPAEEGDPQ